MFFRILGPTAVEAGNGERILGGPRHRVLLTVLLMSRGRIVPVERLIDAMWGEDPPERAVEMVHVRVSELRKLLRAESDAEQVRTRRPGYLLDVAREQIDAYRFERLVADGRRALAAASGNTAFTALTAAEALWRGPALAELVHRAFAEPEIARLENLRRQATSDRMDALLAIGRQREAVAELEGLVRADPLHERHRGQPMIALYRDGRQGAALDVYRDVADRLREELGADPGAELQQLRPTILRQDPRLAAERPRRHDLPAALTSFVGRRHDLAATTSRLAATRLVTLTGVGGSGKSRLAVEAARATKDRFLDGPRTAGSGDPPGTRPA